MPSLFNSSVRKSELVSMRSGVSSSEPTAIISAFICSISNQRQAADVPIEREQRVRGGKNRAARGLQRHAHNAGAAEHHLGLRLRRDPHNPASPAVRSRHIEISVAVQGNALRSSQSAEENAHLAALRNSV